MLYHTRSEAGRVAVAPPLSTPSGMQTQARTTQFGRLGSHSPAYRSTDTCGVSGAKWHDNATLHTSQSCRL